MNKYFFEDITKERYMFEPVDGCSVGCKYCNAYIGALQLGIVKNWKDWINPKVKDIDKNVFENEIKQVISNDRMLRDFIFCGSTTDPFCNTDTSNVIIYGIKLINDSGLRTRVLTKCKIPKEYKNLNPKLNQIGITITDLEMFNTHVLLGNIKTLSILKKKGFFILISFQPYNLNKAKLWDFNLVMFRKLTFVDQITFGILDKYHPNMHPSQYNKAFKLSDYIANYCEKHEINFMNGSKYFCNANKKRLKEMRITNLMKYRNERGQKIK